MGAVLAGAAVVAWLTALTMFDVRQRRLPNALTLPGAAVIVIAAAADGRGTFALVGACALVLPYLVVHAVAPASMGAGDVKLAFGAGALTGAFGIDVWALAAVGAPLLTAVWGIVVVATGGDAGESTGVGGRHTVPHGPSMCLATFVAVALVIV